MKYQNRLKMNPSDLNVYRNIGGTTIIRPLWGRIFHIHPFAINI